MDKRAKITETVLRDTLHKQPQPFEPPFFNERVMRAVRREQQRMLRRERQLLFVPVVVGILLLIGIGAWYLIHLSRMPVEALTPSQFILLSMVGCGALLYLLQDWLCKRWGLPR